MLAKEAGIQDSFQKMGIHGLSALLQKGYCKSELLRSIYYMEFTTTKPNCLNN